MGENERGDDRINPELYKKLSIRSRVLRNNCLEGLFTQSQDLLIKLIFRHLSLQKYRKTFSLALLKRSFLVKCFLYAAADPSVVLKSYRYMYLAKQGYSA